MDNLKWIKELIQAEQKMEEQGIIDYTTDTKSPEQLHEDTIDFLKDIKISFSETTAAFNELKASSLGSIKLYAISNTEADFMLFRNGYKLIFSEKKPGQIRIYFNHMNSPIANAAPSPKPQNRTSLHQQEITLESRVGLFGDLTWLYYGQEFKFDFLIKYFTTRFIKESSR